MTEIYKDDDYLDMALKIYESFSVNQSVNIVGLVQDLEKDVVEEKGKMVLDLLNRYDKQDNIKSAGPRMCRKYVYLENAVGGPLAHKIFKWRRVVVDNKPKYTIWRIQ
jgi:hypothetical protein